MPGAFTGCVRGQNSQGAARHAALLGDSHADPAGTLVDVVQQVEPTAGFWNAYAA